MVVVARTREEGEESPSLFFLSFEKTFRACRSGVAQVSKVCQVGRVRGGVRGRGQFVVRRPGVPSSHV